MSHYWEVTLGLWRTAPLQFFWNELLSSLSGPKSRYEVTFSSPVLCCPWGCCRVSSGQEMGWSWGQKGHRLPELEYKMHPYEREGTSVARRRKMMGETVPEYSPWRRIKVLIGKCCILGTKPGSLKDFYFLIYQFYEVHLTFLALQTKAINKCNLLHEWFISAQFKFRVWFILFFLNGLLFYVCHKPRMQEMAVGDLTAWAAEKTEKLSACHGLQTQSHSFSHRGKPCSVGCLIPFNGSPLIVRY